MKEVFIWIGGFVLFVAVAVGLRFGGLLLMPYELTLERKAYKSSFQYVEARQTQLLNLAEKVEAIETEIEKHSDNPALVQSFENQRDALLERIKKEASLIPAESIPRSVQKHIR